jgi:hypothetical protein
MTNKLSQTIGIVGSRAFEYQAQHSPGYLALEEAVWTSPAQSDEKPVQKSRFRRFLEAVSPARLIAALRNR